MLRVIYTELDPIRLMTLLDSNSWTRDRDEITGGDTADQPISKNRKHLHCNLSLGVDLRHFSETENFPNEVTYWGESLFFC